MAAGVAANIRLRNPAALVAGLLVGTYLLFAIKVIKQWEKMGSEIPDRLLSQVTRNPGHLVAVCLVCRPSVHSFVPQSD
jgi:hypothetical protein